MTVNVKGFRTAHHSIKEGAAELRAVARMLPTLSRHERTVVHDEILRVLRDEVEPHMRIDELLLYPEVAERLGDPLVASSMNYDHQAIRDWIGQIAETGPDDPERLQQLLYGLDALIRVHVWKENELFLRPLESPSWPAYAA
jgi:hypothetical protein